MGGVIIKKYLCEVRISVLFTLFFAGSLFAGQDRIEKKVYVADRVNSFPPVIDGILDDNVWSGENWGNEFIQITPFEGDEPSQNTEFKIVFDNDNLYVAVRVNDTEPERIERQGTRRDGEDGDWVKISFDSYSDDRTAFAFSLTAAGVKGDRLISEDVKDAGDVKGIDTSWDPVWYSGVAQDESGWTAEMRIPLNQFRYSNREDQVWGLQVERKLYREEEISFWQFIAQDAPGKVSRYGELRGLQGIRSVYRIELVPYSVGNLETSLKEEGNPFSTSSTSDMRGGLDGKIGITGGLTLDMTVNPDFGQVEADPSVVNLTAFETFFVEKRLFFVEGKNILDFKLTGGGYATNDNLFYSRRIGQVPHYEPPGGDNMYVDMPSKTSIAAAMKLTGKTGNGVSVGILEAVTTKEEALIQQGGQQNTLTVEPLTNYFAGRLQKDFRRGDTRIGGMVTATNRNIKDSHLNFLNTAAYAGGFDIVHNWKDKTYNVSVMAVFSHIRGSQEAMLHAQTASARYFQRPDAGHVSVDSSAAALSGYGLSFNLGRAGHGHWTYKLESAWFSPGLELNDIGFLRETDIITQRFSLGYREWVPRLFFRNYSIEVNNEQAWSFGGDKIYTGGGIHGNIQFKNYWKLGAGIQSFVEGLSKNMLRGGPYFKITGRNHTNYNINSDSRKKMVVGITGGYDFYNDGVSYNHKLSPSIAVRPNNSLKVSCNPFFTKNVTNLQYVATRTFGNSTRYIFGRIDQKTVGIVFRLDYSITPDFTVEYYGQPFVSAGNYSRFKMITDTRAERYEDRFLEFTDVELSYDPERRMYAVKENPEGPVLYGFPDPDFNVQEFRSNLVVRWEYKPGSTIFLVWTQNRTGRGLNGQFSLRDGMNDLFHIYPRNIFLVKVNHWFSL